MVLLFCYMDMLSKLQKQVCKTLVLHLHPLLNSWYMKEMQAAKVFSVCITFGRCSFELAESVPLPYPCWGTNSYYNRLHDFFLTFPRCYKYV